MPRQISLKEIANQTPDVRAVVGILMRANKFLVSQRPPGKPYNGYWEFPGGKIEKNEQSEFALKRELYEELGIEVIAASPWFEHTHSYPDKTVLLHFWLVTQFKCEPISKENQILRWVSYAEFSQLKMLDANLTIIERLSSLRMSS